MFCNKIKICSILFFVLSSLVTLLHYEVVRAANFICKKTPLIEITAADESTKRDICSAAGKALDFLSRYNLSLKRSVRIEIVEEAISSSGYIAFGSYDRQKELIRLMSYSSIISKVQSPQMYDQPFDVAHYQGAVAHEVTHAVFHHNSRNVEDQLTSAPQEYLAHSTQLATLSGVRRKAIIAANDVGPWESGDSISDIYMGLNPTGFAVKSYLHLTQLEDPKHFIKLLLNNNWFYISVP